MKAEGHIVLIIAIDAAASGSRLATEDAIEFLPIEADGGRYVLGILLATFDLEGMDIGIDQFLQVFARIEVFHAEEEPVTRFIENLVGLAAGIGAFASVAAAGVFRAAEEAEAAVTVAEAAVTEGFHFDIEAFNGGLNPTKFLGGKLARDDNALETKIDRGENAGEIVDRELRGGVKANRREILANEARDAEILNDHGMNADPLEFGELKAEAREFGFFQKDIESDEDLHAIAAREGRELSQILESEVFGASSSIELLETKIDGVSAGLKSGKELFSSSCGSQDLRHSHNGRRDIWGLVFGFNFIPYVFDSSHGIPL